MTGKGYPESTPADRAFIEREEGEINFIYDDAKSPPRKYLPGTSIVGNLTGGTGHLISRHNQIVDQAAYTAYVGKTIPQPVIDAWLDDDLNAAEKVVNDTLKVALPANFNRGALYSLAFNIGNGAYAGSGVVRKLNDKNWNALPTEFAKWNKTTILQNGVKVRVTSAGLTRRRADETAYLFGGKAPPAAPASAKAIPKATEIATASAKPTSPFEWASLAVGGLTGGSAFASAEGFVGIAIGVAILIAVLIGAGIIIKRQFFRS